MHSLRLPPFPAIPPIFACPDRRHFETHCVIVPCEEPQIPPQKSSSWTRTSPVLALSVTIPNSIDPAIPPAASFFAVTAPLLKHLRTDAKIVYFASLSRYREISSFPSASILFSKPILPTIPPALVSPFTSPVFLQLSTEEESLWYGS